MPSATLGANLVDVLVPVVDGLRASLYPQMGIRQHKVSLVRRRYASGTRGNGPAVITSDVEIAPPPLLTLPNNQGALRYDLEAHGKEEEGAATLTEVSLTYTEAELTGGAVRHDEEFFYRVEEDLGQGVKTRYYTLAAPPTPDREKGIGWVVQLRRIEIEE